MSDKGTVISLNDNEMLTLAEFVSCCESGRFWITAESDGGIGTKLTVSHSSGKKRDISDYESW